MPSYLIRPGDVIRVKNRPKSLHWCKASMAEVHRDVPDFLIASRDDIPEGHVLRVPEAADVSIPVQTQMIVELCSK